MQLVVHNLALKRGGRFLRAPVRFAVMPGQMLLLLGGNGSGKSTLLRLLAGLLPLQGGSVVFAGRLVYVGHANGLLPCLTAGEHVAFWRGLAGLPADAAADAAVLARMGLAGQRDGMAGRLSAGQQRRLALSRVLLGTSDLWLLDEPQAALDAEGLAGLTAMLAAHKQAGGMAVVASHGGLESVSDAVLRLEP